MSKRSFWEKLGRGVGYGLHKAREAGEKAEEKLELRVEREKLKRHHEALGRLVAAAAGSGEPAVELGAGDIAALLAAIRECEEEIARLESAGTEDAGTPVPEES
jgi:hypothetical protein